MVKRFLQVCVYMCWGFLLVCVCVCVCVYQGFLLTQGGQELVAAREPPEQDTDGRLDGREGEVLLPLHTLQLHQHLMELHTAEALSHRHTDTHTNRQTHMLLYRTCMHTYKHTHIQKHTHTHTDKYTKTITLSHSNTTRG